MIAFQVNDMTCGHCVSAITRAVQAVDPDAVVRIDLAAHRVTVEPVEAGAAALQEAIAGAGYTPALLDATTAPSAAGRTGCCGGCR